MKRQQIKFLSRWVSNQYEGETPYIFIAKYMLKTRKQILIGKELV